MAYSDIRCSSVISNVQTRTVTNRAERDDSYDGNLLDLIEDICLPRPLVHATPPISVPLSVSARPVGQDDIARMLGDRDERTRAASEAYRVLGLPHGASWTDVVVAYRDLICGFHPDEDNARAAARFIGELNHAFTTLKQVHRR